ncbi:ATP-grasp domain-containing protein [Micromonospora rubida]
MTLLVLNRRPIVDRIPDWLADLDEDLILVTAASALSPGAPEPVGYRHVTVVDDYDRPEVDAVVLDLARRYGVGRILGTTEVDVLRAARLREQLGLPGQSLASAQAYRDKHRMKSIVAAAGLPVAPMRLLGSVGELRDFVARNGLPCVVKPVSGAGSVGVHVLADLAETERFVAAHAAAGPGQLLAESWVSGSAYHVDGLMAGGRVVHCWPSRMRYPNLDAVTDSRPFLSWMLPRADPIGQRLRDLLTAVVAALPGPDEVTAFHAEVFHRPDDDRLVLCEIACRPGGGGIVPSYEHALGVNLYAASLRGQAGRPPPASTLVEDPGHLSGFGWFPPRIGQLLTIPTDCPIPGVYRYSTTGRIGADYQGARSISDNVAKVLLSGRAEEGLDERMAQLESWWNHTCAWGA